MDPIEIRRQLAEVAKRMKALWKAEMTDAETKEFDDLNNRAKQLEADLATAEAREARQARMAALDSRLTGMGSQDNHGDQLPHQTDSGLRHGYSLLTALGQLWDGRSIDGVAGETHQELQKRMGKSAQGLIVPWDLRIGDHYRAERSGATAAELRTLTTAPGSGAGVIPTILDGTMIDYLRATPLLAQLGARILTDMTGKFAIPKQTSTGASYWITEGANVTRSNPATGQVLYEPKTLASQGEYTRSFMKQTSVDAEGFIREDFARNMALGVDKAGFNGSGIGAEPEGICQNPNVIIIPLGTPNGGAPDWAKIVSLETAVDTENALFGNLAYVTTPQGRGKLKTTPKVANFPEYLWDRDGRVNSYAAYATNQLPSNLAKGTGTSLSALLFGNFNSCMFAFWGGMDVIINPFTLDESGSRRITMMQDADFGVRHDQAFAKAVDMITS